MKIISLLVLIFFIQSCKTEDDIYFGELTPNNKAKLFIPELFSDIIHSSPSFNISENKIYWSVVSIDNKSRKIYCSEFQENKWSTPIIFFGQDKFHYDQPFLSEDENILYFGSNRTDSTKDISLMSIWRSKTNGNELTNIEPISGMWTPSFTKEKKVYFIDRENAYKNNIAIFSGKIVNGKIQEREILPKEINNKNSQNWCPYISPDECYLLFASDRNKEEGDFDIYVSFRNITGKWSKAMNLGNTINTDKQERFPSVSPDEKYLFFTRFKESPNKHNLYWIESSIIDSLRSKL